MTNMHDPKIQQQRRMSISQSRTYHGQNKRPYSDEFYTPCHIPAALGPFDCDPSAGPNEHARSNIRLPKNGLTAKWKGRVWLNPPYSNIEAWLARFMEHRNGIALVNARPETIWFQTLAAEADAMLFLRGRTKFLTPDGVARNPPVGSVLVAYGPRNAKALKRSGLPGIIVEPVI